MWKLRQSRKIVGVFLIRVFNKTAKAVLFGCFKSSLRRSRKNKVNTFFAAKAACHTYGTIKWQQAILSKISIIPASSQSPGMLLLTGK